MAIARKSPRPIRLRVPGSTSNVGPGFDCFSVAVDLDLSLSWEPAASNSLERTGALAESTLPRGSDPVVRGMRRAAMLAGKELPAGKLVVDAQFPAGRGLGASGAGLAAGLVLGNRLSGGGLDLERLHAEAIALEGHPENATASLLGGAHWSLPVGRSGQPPRVDWHHLPVSLHKDLRFLVVVPPYTLETRRAREVLPTSVSFQRAVMQARRTPVLLEGLRQLNPELIRIGVQDELHVAPRLKLMPAARSMLDFADRAGALGTTLSGAGSALLVITRTGAMRALEEKLAGRVRRLWGEDGAVLQARVAAKGAAFV